MAYDSMAKAVSAKLALKIYDSEVKRLDNFVANKTKHTSTSCVVTAFANSKGGTAKSSTCQAMAAAIALDPDLRARVLIIELDPRGSADNISCIRNHREDDHPSAVDVWVGYAFQQNYYHPDMRSPFSDADIYTKYINAGLSHREILKLAIEKTDIATLDVIPAHFTDARVTAEAWMNYAHTKQLNCLDAFHEGVINHLAEQYDFIFIDTPSDLNIITLAAINSASVLLTPIPPQQLALQGTLGFFNDLYCMLDELPNRGENIKVIKSIIVNYDDSSKLDKSMLIHIKQILSDKCMTNSIHRSLAFEAAMLNYCNVFGVNTGHVSKNEIEKLASVKNIAREFITLLETLT